MIGCVSWTRLISVLDTKMRNCVIIEKPYLQLCCIESSIMLTIYLLKKFIANASIIWHSTVRIFYFMLIWIKKYFNMIFRVASFYRKHCINWWVLMLISRQGLRTSTIILDITDRSIILDLERTFEVIES